MGLLDKITTSNLGLKGVSPAKFGDTAKLSTLHNEYSINDNPHLNGKPVPSTLDLDGRTPAKYLDNPPR
jgi:hypothetical protein